MRHLQTKVGHLQTILAGSAVCFGHNHRQPRTEIFNSRRQSNRGIKRGTIWDFLAAKSPWRNPKSPSPNFLVRYWFPICKTYQKERRKNAKSHKKKFMGIFKIPKSPWRNLLSPSHYFRISCWFPICNTYQKARRRMQHHTKSKFMGISHIPKSPIPLFLVRCWLPICKTYQQAKRKNAKSVKWDLTNPHNPHPAISYKALIPNM